MICNNVNIPKKNLQEFPPKSNLDSETYGNQHSFIREEHIEPNMNGLNVQEVSIIYFFLFNK